MSLRAKKAEPWPPSAPRPFRPGRRARLRQTAADAPVSLRRTPSGFGLRYGLMAKGNICACSVPSGHAA
ncbi:hypothetical protein D5067_0023615 (plasmid) [Enterobacter huaxiensis]|nr:hypothetical protein D5067_0023615 [Enterobacter huaxiensis]